MLKSVRIGNGSAQLCSVINNLLSAVIVLSSCHCPLLTSLSTHCKSFEGLALGDILKPELIMPLLEMLPVQERLSSHLPEVCLGLQCFLYSMKMNIHAIFSLLVLSFENVKEKTKSSCEFRVSNRYRR